MWDTPAGIHLAVERRRERQEATGCIDADITSPPQIILQSSSLDSGSPLPCTLVPGH